MVVPGNETALPLITGEISLFTLIVGIALVIIMAYVVYKVIKNLIANAIFGGIGLLVLHFLLGPMTGVDVPITIGNIVISLIAGLPGLVIVVLLALMSITV